MIKFAQKRIFRGFTTNSLRVRGFTLIELLIVIAILGILAAAVLVAINPGKRTRQAQDAKRKNDIGAMATELQGYYTAPGAGAYPSSLATLTSESYLKQMPRDPTGGSANYSYVTSGGTNGPTEVALYATLAEPTSGSGTGLTIMWCWRSSAAAVSEVTPSGNCTAL